MSVSCMDPVEKFSDSGSETCYSIQERTTDSCKNSDYLDTSSELSDDLELDNDGPNDLKPPISAIPVTAGFSGYRPNKTVSSLDLSHGNGVDHSGSETCRSIQGRTTDTCKNSDYLDSSTEEYDVVSLVDDQSANASDSTSTYEDVGKESNVEEFTFGSSLCDTNSDDNEDLRDVRKICSLAKCSSCHEVTPSFMKYCVDCWQDRKKSVPRPPPRKKRKCDLLLNVYSDSKSRKELELDLKCKAGNSNFVINSVVDCIRPPVPEGICKLCETQKATHSLLHNKISHQCVCHECGKKLSKFSKRDRKCPYCKRSFSYMLENKIIS